MTLRVFAAAIAALSLSACATATVGSQRLEIDPALAQSSHINVVRMTSEWVRANEDFTDTFTDSVLENVRACATGPNKLDLHIHVIGVQRENRLVAVLDGGQHEIAAIAELVEPSTRTVVGRYPIHVAVDAGSPIAALLSDRQLMVSDAFATELCNQAFGR
ncbi:hypothetical protein [Phenylobacterium sp.]|jgi:hypothetical protein|uniref:hypothetical protein n=1 Tax=Phenylobacterium sp. TaxID=1871053 RepID=UPI002F92CA54